MSERAVSEVLSFTLVFALIVTSVAIVSVSGLGSLQDVRDAEQLENAERAFDVLADNLADLHRQGAPSRATEISLGQAQLATEDNVTMTVKVEDDSGTTIDVGTWEIRPLVYSGNQDRELVYEAGAIFRTNRDSGFVVRDPPLVVDDDRVLLSIIGLNSPQVQSLGGSTVLVRATHREADVAFSRTDGSIQSLTVQVESPREAQWEQYFESHGFTCTGSAPVSCEYDPGSNFERVYVVYHDIGVGIDE
ncbi:hypothetical protein ACFQGE_13810 [Halomicroarcula sp. GCM10025817]|uniref:DUF7289 family protein n=1 Tax=Haloarcula TaxID=2237 RepID=UPI0023E8777E|nr:hypothetical protein [Halomicroarcula sp. SYNS111]